MALIDYENIDAMAFDDYVKGKSVMVWKTDPLYGPTIRLIGQIPEYIIDEDWPWNQTRLVDDSKFLVGKTIINHLEKLDNEIEQIKQRIKQIDEEKQMGLKSLRNLWDMLSDEPSAKSAYSCESSTGLEGETNEPSPD